jgi:hypothetical protein
LTWTLHTEETNHEKAHFEDVVVPRLRDLLKSPKRMRRKAKEACIIAESTGESKHQYQNTRLIRSFCRALANQFQQHLFTLDWLFALLGLFFGLWDILS